MVQVSPGKGRATVTTVPRGVRIVIPARRNLLVILVLGLWLVGWAVGEAAALGALLGEAGIVGKGLFQGPKGGPGAPFLILWLAFWTAGGGAALLAWLWTAFGREIVTVTDRTFTLRRDVLGLGGDREHAMAHVRNLRVSLVPFSPWDTRNPFRVWNNGIGTIAFDYGARTVRFGVPLDEAEANRIVARIAGQFAIPADGA